MSAILNDQVRRRSLVERVLAQTSELDLALATELRRWLARYGHLA